MTQAYVDTTVMRAIFVLNEASAQYSASSNRQSHAVSQARTILSELKFKAKGDINERYALMKIQEVEAQIYLEEEEMRRIADDRRILTANQLVLQYNGEVGKMRPDFAMLKGLFRRMAEVDTRQANNLANSYNNRYRQISRDAMYALEKALAANDYDMARRELEYCDKNKNYLLISSSQLASQRERLDKIHSAQNELPRIISSIDEGEKAYRELRLSESRTSLTMAQSRLNGIRPYLASNDGASAAAKADRALRALDFREDSLVAVAMVVLDSQGPDAAIEYLQEVLQKRMNISFERASVVDQAIMKLRPERALESKVKMVEADTTGSDKDYAMVVSVQNKAMRRAQEKADSLRIVRDRAANISINIYTLLEHNKSKDASRLFNKEKAFLSSVMDKNAFAMLDASVQNGAVSAAAAGANADKNKKKAEGYMTEIYSLLEKNNIKGAYQRFNKYKKPLGKYLDKESYNMLELTVVQSYNSVAKK
jgi:hypothetical protein